MENKNCASGQTGNSKKLSGNCGDKISMIYIRHDNTYAKISTGNLLVDSLKGQCHQIFHLCFFFFKQLLQAQVDKPSNDFDFFRIFAEIFDFSGASPVSLTPAKQTILL